MKTTIDLMNIVIQEADAPGTSKEHKMEQAHYAALNVENVMSKKFDLLVEEVKTAWGAPEQNTTVNWQDKRRSPLPKWLHEATNIAGSSHLLKVAYWKRQGSYSYIALKVELDHKDRPNYYNLVIGARRRISQGANVGNLRNQKPWWAFLLPWYHW